MIRSDHGTFDCVFAAGLCWLIYCVTASVPAASLPAAWFVCVYLIAPREYLDGFGMLILETIPASFVFAVVSMDGKLAVEEVRAMAEEHLIGQHRFRQRVRRGQGFWSWWWPYWEADPHFDLGAHIAEHREPLTHGELERWVSRSMGQDMDWTRPLFELHLFTSATFEDGAQGSTLVIKFHHCMGDGVTMVRAKPPLPRAPVACAWGA